MLLYSWSFIGLFLVINHRACVIHVVEWNQVHLGFQNSSVNTFKAIVILLVKDGIVGASLYKLFPAEQTTWENAYFVFSYKNKIAIFQQNMLIMPSGTSFLCLN